MTGRGKRRLRRHWAVPALLLSGAVAMAAPRSAPQAELDFDDSSRQGPDTDFVPLRDHGALIAELQTQLHRLRRTPQPQARIPIYREALRLLDQVLLDEPGYSFDPGLQPLVLRYLDDLNRERRTLSGAARERNLSEARAVAVRIDNPAERVTRLLDIVQMEVTHGASEAQTLANLHGLLRESGPRLPERDATLSRVIGIAAPVGAQARRNARLWLAEIRDPVLRSQSLGAIAQAAIAADPLLSELVANEQLGPDRDERLLDLSSYMAREGRFDAATWTAALVSDRKARDRDEALDFVVAHMIEGKVDVDDIVAVHGIGDGALRNRALLDLSEVALDRDALAQARRFASLMAPSLESVLAWTRIGRWLSDKDYAAQAAAAADIAYRQLQALPRQASERRDAVLVQLVPLFAQHRDRQRAELLLAQIQDRSGADEVRGALVEAALAAGDGERAQRLMEAMQPGPALDRARAERVELLAKAGRFDEALPLAESIKTPLPRLDALNEVMKAIDPLGPWAPQIPVLAGRITATAAKVPLGEGQDEAAALAAIAQALLGDFGAAQQQLARAVTAKRYRDALARVAERQALVQGPEQALQGLAASWDRSARLRAEKMIAGVLAKQNRVDEAVKLARRIADDRLRVEAFRRIAEVAAGQTDTHDLLKGSSAPEPLRRPRVGPELPLLRASGKEVFRLPNGDLGEQLPPVPPLDLHTAETVAADIPAIAPGSIHVIPLHYSDFNQKFLASLSYFFNDYGGRLFYFDAQNTPFPVFISLDTGVFDLPSIQAYLAQTGQSQYLTRRGRVYELGIPLLVGPKARLVISGADVEELRLLRDSGAYIVNAGGLQVYDTRVIGWDAVRQQPAELTEATRGNFRPFIVSWSGSTTDMAKSMVSHLGFAGGKGYGLAFSAGPKVLLRNQPLGLRRPLGRLVDNSFQHMLYGLYTYEADDLVVVGNEYRDNLVYGIDPHDRSRRLLIAYNSTYDTRLKHGIIISREVNDSWIVGNVSFDNHGSGVMLDRNSQGNLVYANTAFANGLNGVAVYESPCNIVAGNLLHGNAGDGVKLRNSWDVGVFANRLLRNKGVAIKSYVAEVAPVSGGHVRDFELDPYMQFSDVAIVDNTIRENSGGGISLKGVATLAWKKNELISQVKPLKGTMEELMPTLVGGSERGVLARAACSTPVREYSCSLKARGFLAGQTLYEQPGQPAAAACTAGGTRTADAGSTTSARPAAGATP